MANRRCTPPSCSFTRTFRNPGTSGGLWRISVNGDAGATFTPAQVAQTVGAVRGGDIVISHFNRPGKGTAAGYAQVLPTLLDRGVTFTTLARATA